MESTVIRHCSCKHEAQDKLYGEGRRVFNFAPKKGPQGSYVCTVCLKTIAK